MVPSSVRGGGAGRLPLAVAVSEPNAAGLQREESQIRAQVREFEERLRSQMSLLLQEGVELERSGGGSGRRGSARGELERQAELELELEWLRRQPGARVSLAEARLHRHLEGSRTAPKHLGLDRSRAGAEPSRGGGRLDGGAGRRSQRGPSTSRHGGQLPPCGANDWRRGDMQVERDRAACAIQRHFRGSVARQEVAARKQALLREEQERREREQAALRIQSGARGWAARREVEGRRQSELSRRDFARRRSSRRGSASRREQERRAREEAVSQETSWHERCPGLPERPDLELWQSQALDCKELSLRAEETRTEVMLLRQRKASRLSEVSRLERLVELCSDGRLCGSCDLRVLGLQSILQALGRLCRVVAGTCDPAERPSSPRKGCHSVLADVAEVLHECSAGLPRKGFANLEVLGQEVDDLVAYLAAVGHPRRTQSL